MSATWTNSGLLLCGSIPHNSQRNQSLFVVHHQTAITFLIHSCHFSVTSVLPARLVFNPFYSRRDKIFLVWPESIFLHCLPLHTLNRGISAISRHCLWLIVSKIESLTLIALRWVWLTLIIMYVQKFLFTFSFCLWNSSFCCFRFLSPAEFFFFLILPDTLLLATRGNKNVTTKTT